MRTNHDEPRHDPLVDMGYETKDINISAIRTASIWFFGFTIFSFGIVAVGMAFLGMFDPPPGMNTETMRSKRIPGEPNPLLQTNVTVKQDMVDLRKAENEALESYRLVDPATNKVAIPIDRAIELAAERKGKLPAEGASPNSGGESPIEGAQPTRAAQGERR